MPRMLFLLGLSAVCFLFAGSSEALHKDRVIKKSMTAADVLRFHVDLEPGLFAVAEIEQDGIDVEVDVLDPEGKVLKTVDSPNGTQGREVVTFVTPTVGRYLLVVRSLMPDVPPGRIGARFVRTKPAATTLEGKLDELFAVWDNDTGPGASIALVRDGEVIFKKGYGLANLEYGVPNRPDTVFHVASVSKQFTAFAAAMLHHRLMIDLDADMRTYIPELPDFGHKITPRHLVHHTSGLRDQWELLMLSGWRLDDVITLDHIMALITRQKELNFKPGEKFAYCNTGYTLLAEMVARVTDMPFKEWTRKHIFDPLGMADTHFHDDHEHIVRNRAYSYRENGPHYKKSVLSYANVGATSLFTTVEDMAKWAISFETQALGDAELYRTMESRPPLNDGSENNYAFGQGIAPYKGLKLVRHSGGDAGFRSFLGRFPEQRFNVVLLSNAAALPASGQALAAAELYLADQLTEAPKKPVANAEGTEAPKAKPAKPDGATLKTYTGRYFSEELNTSYDVRVEEDKLVIRHPRTGDFPLRSIDRDKFQYQYWFRVNFQKDDQGKVNGFAISSSRVHGLKFARQ
ncbi:MAG: serine hydrolase domain-containing protein [Acidobacteriota bacterium]|nr:serine hydrolase domain-containing protein [Acidobacteriota bacterium]